MYKSPILSGIDASKNILLEIKECIEKMEKKPKLVIVQVGNNPASNSYIKMKTRKAELVGMDSELKKLDEKTTEKELLKIVEELNKDKKVTGFIVQLPLPKHINEIKVIEKIDPKKDVDGFTSTNIGKLFLGVPEQELLLPATPSGIIKMLEHYNVQIKGKNAVVIGRSNIVGKPIASMLINRSATVTVCHSKTKDLSEHTKQADILIVAIGKPGFVKADMVKEGAYVIDVGTTRVKDKICGDVDFETVIKKAHCSPVPGGVGRMTVAMLISNVVKAAKN